MLTKPYIGVTGIMTADDINTITAVFSSDRYQLMAGILVSERTLLGRPANPSRKNRYPAVLDIPDILRGIEKPEGVLKLLHYSGRSETLGENLAHMHNRFAKGPFRIDGYQLNMEWPDPVILREYRIGIGANMKIVLQIGKAAMEAVNRSPEEMIWHLDEYRSSCDAVILDMSGGMAEPIKPSFIAPFVEALDRDCPELSIVVAGGFAPGHLDGLQSLKGRLGPSLAAKISTDMEGGVRTNDCLDLDKACACVLQQWKLLGS